MTFLRIVIPLYLFDLSMISAQTRSAFVARENRYPLFRIMLRFIPGGTSSGIPHVTNRIPSGAVRPRAASPSSLIARNDRRIDPPARLNEPPLPRPAQSLISSPPLP